ncbi:MAG: hypothetical protein ACLS43_05900 [Evtepia gabavorous]
MVGGMSPRYWRPPCAGRGDHFEETAPSAPLLTKADLFACGLSGGGKQGKTAGSAA